jgi:hypothetical protein
MAVGALLAHFAMHTRVAISVSETDLVSHLISSTD